jgi:alkylated DNA repair dioxygenase AlkB
MFWQSALALDPAPIERVQLDAQSWIDFGPSWLPDADDLFAELVGALPWNQRDVVMWDRPLAEPRLTWWWDVESEPAPARRLDEIRLALSETYVPLHSIGCNLYRDGRDSVAWHGDRVGATDVNPLVAIVSLGERRRFLLRPKGGGASYRFDLGAGDLLVMGGACQHQWEHCVPKCQRSRPRLSVTFRHRAVAAARPQDQQRVNVGLKGTHRASRSSL